MITLYQFKEIKNNNNMKENNILEKNKSKAPFVLYYKFKYYLEFYNKNGIFMNKIDHKPYMYDLCEVVEYDNNILLLRSKLQFLFLYISPDYKNYEFSRVLSLDFGFYFRDVKKIIKMNNNNICLYSKKLLHFIKFDYDKIFNNNYPLILDAREYCEVINSKDLIDQMIANVIYIFCDNNKIKKIKKIIGISFIIDNFDKRIYQDIYYQLKEIVNFRLIYYDNDVLNKLKKEIIIKKMHDRTYIPIPKESKLIMSIIIFNDLGKIEKNFEVNLQKNDALWVMFKGLNNLRFYYFHNFILSFFYFYAYLINLQNNEIISIYELEIDKFPSYRTIAYLNNKNKKDEIDVDSPIIKQYILDNNVRNVDLKEIIKGKSVLNDYIYYDKKEELVNLNTKYIVKNQDNKEITFNDYEESRIIKIKKLCITLDNKNNIIINNNIRFNSIVNSSIYKVLFPNYINKNYDCNN